tara:strand:+ start:3803 stop:4138 length:336 start_codon:yes stop_codon:yes gene_type:complete
MQDEDYALFHRVISGLLDEKGRAASSDLHKAYYRMIAIRDELSREQRAVTRVAEENAAFSMTQGEALKIVSEGKAKDALINSLRKRVAELNKKNEKITERNMLIEALAEDV